MSLRPSSSSDARERSIRNFNIGRRLKYFSSGLNRLDQIFREGSDNPSSFDSS